LLLRRGAGWPNGHGKLNDMEIGFMDDRKTRKRGFVAFDIFTELVQLKGDPASIYLIAF
jgi:hypothetical protein